MAVSLLTISAVFGGSMSTLQVTGYFDNHSVPVPYAVDGSDAAEIAFAGDWFDSGECDLYVNGAFVARSTGPVQTYALPVIPGIYQNYFLTLKSGEAVAKKLLTVFPYAGYVCTLHMVDIGDDFLDARPGDTVRKIRPEEIAKITWSGLWNAAADQSVVKLYAGTDTSGECLKELVNVQGVGEGFYPLRPDDEPMNAGSIYTLTHFDGVETLTAHFGIRGGAVLILR